MEKKICKSCGLEKKLDSFTKNKTLKSGRMNICKICFNKRAAEYRIKGKPKKKEVELDADFRLTNTKIYDWCRMWKIVEKLGYDIHGDIHQQFCDKHSLPYKKKPSQNIKTYIPSDCVEIWKIFYEGAE